MEDKCRERGEGTEEVEDKYVRKQAEERRRTEVERKWRCREV